MNIVVFIPEFNLTANGNLEKIYLEGYHQEHTAVTKHRLLNAKCGKTAQI